ncbi:hypothetical protein GF322_01800 [Candidatus Dependentiae bacterium]|nr:hypothetical protein [Candidatus Dependentiae bacterium]
MSSYAKKNYCAIFLFLMVFIIFAFLGRDVWFQVDDVGNIAGRIVRSLNDLFKLFTEDERTYIYPINFTIPKPNFISGFYRPLQHIPFTIIYNFFGFNPYAYYLTNVFFHSLNVVLFFYFCLLFIQFNLAIVGSLLLAFYPFYDWIAWLSCLHNFLAIFFLILSLIFYRQFWFSRKMGWQILSAFMFFLSIVSRENTIVLGIWIFWGIFLFCYRCSFLQKFKSVFLNGWAFFVTYIFYFFIRFYSFGYQSLNRTFNNFLLKVPFLKSIFFKKINPVIVNGNLTNITNNSNVLNSVKFSALSKVDPSSVNSNIITNYLFAGLKNKLNFLMDKIKPWFEVLFNLSFDDFFNKLIIFFIIIFIFYSYRNHKKIFFFLFSGIILFVWPGIVAYPNPRYISAVYPILIFTFVLGIDFFKKENISLVKKQFFSFLIVGFAYVSTFGGMYKNIKAVPALINNFKGYQEKFVKFFTENNFAKKSNFIVLGSPFVSDIKNVFQMFLQDLDLKVACVRLSTLAEKGCMGCVNDYKIKGVKSRVKSVNIDNKRGFRLISEDESHCCWWMNLSHFPLRWNKKNRAYVWANNIPKIGKWYDFSMGKYMINKRLQDKYITDVIFLFDNEWIDENTIFVTWDTFQGKYKILEWCL